MKALLSLLIIAVGIWFVALVIQSADKVRTKQSSSAAMTTPTRSTVRSLVWHKDVHYVTKLFGNPQTQDTRSLVYRGISRDEDTGAIDGYAELVLDKNGTVSDLYFKAGR